ncbi:DctP family TRAP transporter solute-binding subunit [Variovorax paradoxus]|uniref:DctP family TRAP transporter solute-binding subunit n=1 Tax=Variovorax paradoxus TaxID=34073 RepID=UPI003D64F9FB
MVNRTQPRSKQSILRGIAAALSCSLALVANHAQAQIRDHKVKLAFVTAADTGALNGVDKFVELVKQKSSGKIDIKVFPNGTLGGDVQMISSLQGGTIDMSVMGTNALVGVVKEFGLLDFPFLLDNDKEASSLIDGPVGKQMFDKLAAKGVVGMPISAFGFRHLHNSKRPINKAEDIQGLKLRVIQSPVYVDLMGALGANPVAMSFTEVYNAMEQKAIDGMTNTALIASSMKAYEVQKYMSLTAHMYNYIVLLVSGKSWDRFNADEKALIIQAATEAKEFQRKKIPEYTSQALAVLAKNGMVVNDVSTAERARLREKAKPVVDKYTGVVGEALVKEAHAELAKLRK